MSPSIFRLLRNNVVMPLLGRAWAAYRRVLNLPILAAVADGAAGVGSAWR